MAKSQKELLREHLKAGKTITRPQAERWYGIGRISARISELRNDDGYNIGSKGVAVKKENGEYATIAVYYDPEYVDKEKIGPEAATRNGTPNFNRYRKDPEPHKTPEQIHNESTPDDYRQSYHQDPPPDDDLPSGDISESFKKNFNKDEPVNQQKVMPKTEESESGVEYVECECDNNREVKETILEALESRSVMDKVNKDQPLQSGAWIKVNKSLFVSVNWKAGSVSLAAKENIVNQPTFEFTANKIYSYLNDYKPSDLSIKQTSGFDIPKISDSTIMHYAKFNISKV